MTTTKDKEQPGMLKLVEEIRTTMCILYYEVFLTYKLFQSVCSCDPFTITHVNM